MAISIIFLILFFAFTSKAKENQNHNHLNITEFIEYYGYEAETHEVTTKDGYILKMFRIPHAKGGSGINRKPIFLMHGLFSQAESFIIAGIYNASLAYHLADDGFDVWLGNTRGTRHGSRHKTLDPNSRSFWNFSWHEIGMYDLPASIDYILEKTHVDQLYYIGYSQGGTVFYVMASMRPEYQKKIILASLLGAPAYWHYLVYPPLIPLLKNIRTLEIFGDWFYEVPPHTKSIGSFLSGSCNEEIFQEICLHIYNIMAGYNSNEVQKELMPLVFKYIASTSSKQSIHYVQSARLGRFCRWDYGTKDNLKIYGAPNPPDYPVKNIEVPIAIYYTFGDKLVNTKDVDDLCEDLPKCVRKYSIANPKFTHLDFVFTAEPKMLIYPLLEFLKKY